MVFKRVGKLVMMFHDSYMLFLSQVGPCEETLCVCYVSCLIFLSFVFPFPSRLSAL